MAAAPDRPLRRYVNEAIANLIDDYRDVIGVIDAAALLDGLDVTIEAGDPNFDYGINVCARRALLKQWLRDYLRTSKSGVTAQHWEALGIAKQAKWLRDFEEIPMGGNVYVTKRRGDISLADAGRLATMHATIAAAHALRVDYYGAIVERGRQLGLAETATLNDVLNVAS